MKAIVEKAGSCKERPFPKLMICIDQDNPGMIVFFLKPREGQVVNPGKRWGFDAETVYWSMSCFKDFEGTVTLSND